MSNNNTVETMEPIWYSSDPENGISIHESAEEAENAAKASIEYIITTTEPENLLLEEIDIVSWGKVITCAQAECVSVISPDENNPNGVEQWELVQQPSASEQIARQAMNMLLDELYKLYLPKGIPSRPRQARDAPPPSFADSEAWLFGYEQARLIEEAAWAPIAAAMQRVLDKIK
jgi:hypothetical protein